MKPTLLVLLLPAVAFAKYDPEPERFALRNAATAAYTAATNAAGLSLEPSKIQPIKDGLDEALSQARAAANVAKTLETQGEVRALEMANIVKGSTAKAPDQAAKDLSDAAAAQRARWKKLMGDRQDLKKRVDALPDDDKNKPGLLDRLDDAASRLASADGTLKRAETGAGAMADAAGSMKDAEKRTEGPNDERKQAVDVVLTRADALPPPIAEAKTAADALGTDSSPAARNKANDKLGVPRDLTRELLAGADKACNRADDFRLASNAFDRAAAAFSDAKAAAGDPAQAKAGLDQAEAVLADVRARLK